MDGAGSPRSARRSGHTLGIQLFGDRARRDPGCVLLEDTADDHRLSRIDPALAREGPSVGADAAHDIIAVAVSAAGLSGFDAAAQAAPGLVREILEVQCSHRPFQADMELVDLSLREGDDATAGKADPLEDMGDILLVAGQPVEGFRDIPSLPSSASCSSFWTPGRIRLAPDMPLSLYSL